MLLEKDNVTVWVGDDCKEAAEATVWLPGIYVEHDEGEETLRLKTDFSIIPEETKLTGYPSYVHMADMRFVWILDLDELNVGSFAGYVASVLTTLVGIAKRYPDHDMTTYEFNNWNWLAIHHLLESVALEEMYPDGSDVKAEPAVVENQKVAMDYVKSRLTSK